MNETRAQAHDAMRGLWEAADRHVQATEPVVRDGYTVRSFETEAGAQIMRIGDTLSVEADFEIADGITEVVTLTFPEDIRDLSETRVEVDWETDEASGTNTPPLRDYPKLASEMLALL